MAHHGGSLWPLGGEYTGGWNRVQTRDDGGLDQGDARRKEGGLDLRYLLEIDQIGIGDDLDIRVKGREGPTRLPHLCLKHLGG